MKIGVEYPQSDAIAHYLLQPRTQEWFEKNLDAGTWQLTQSRAGAVTFVLQKTEFDMMQLCIDCMSEELWATPNQWEQQFADDLRKVLKKARNARGTHTKKYRD